MAISNIIVSGDDINILQTLTKDLATFTIDAGATVKASLVSRGAANKTVLVAPVTVLEAATGADWANSLLVIVFPSADTASLTTLGVMELEIQVDDGGKLTWHVNVEMLQGTIDQ